MIVVWVVMIIGFVALAIHGDQHGRRMYRLGLRHGREREAMVARHARERIMEQAERIAIQAYVDACDTPHRGKGQPT